MEGRQSRASSRYASGPSRPVFSGRVRRWKKQWVSSSTSPSTAKADKRNQAAPLLLCRWTPLPDAEEPPPRRFRYTPVDPIVKGQANSAEEEINKLNNVSEMRSESDGMLEVEKDISNSKEEAAEGGNEDQAESDKNQE